MLPVINTVFDAVMLEFNPAGKPAINAPPLAL